MKEKLGLELDETDLDRSHRLGRSSASRKPRPIIAKFVSHNIKSGVFRRKRKLKGQKLAITGSLTKKIMEMYTSVLEIPTSRRLGR